MARKVHMLVRISYGDFDIQQTAAVAVSENRLTLVSMCDDLNKKRTEEEVIYEVHYKVDGNCKLV
jgi:hypothetical protein